MQLQLDDLSVTKKRVQISVPASRVDSAFAAAYHRIAQRVSPAGFRRGHVPVAHLKQRFGREAAMDVAQQLVEQGWRKLLDETSVMPVGEPQFAAGPATPSKDYEYSVTFECVPEFEVKPFSELSVERAKWVASDEVIEHELGHIAEQFATAEPISDHDDARKGDVAVLDYSGSVDGVAFPGGTAQAQELLLGSGQFIPGFEAQVIGRKVGEAFDVNVTFPEQYHSKELAGKAAVFACTLQGLKGRVLPALDDTFAAKLHEETLDGVRARIREEIGNRFEARSLNEARRALRAALGANYDFVVPESLIETATESRKRELVNEQLRAGGDLEEARVKATEAVANEADEILAELRTDLVLDKIASQASIEATEAEISRFIGEMVRQMGPYGEQLRQSYRDSGRRAVLRRRLRHDKALDYVLGLANVAVVERDVPLHKHDDEHDGDADE